MVKNVVTVIYCCIVFINRALLMAERLTYDVRIVHSGTMQYCQVRNMTFLYVSHCVFTGTLNEKVFLQYYRKVLRLFLIKKQSSPFQCLSTLIVCTCQRLLGVSCYRKKRNCCVLSAWYERQSGRCAWLVWVSGTG